MRYRRVGYRYTLIVSQPTGWSGVSVVRAGDVVLAHPHWHPDIDVYEGETAVTVLVELAGVNEEELEVLLFEDALVIDGRRNLPVAEEVVYHAAGIRQGPFRVEVPLPTAVNADKVDASYERGLLRVRVPKSDGGRSNG